MASWCESPASSDGMGKPPSGGTACRDTLKSEHKAAADPTRQGDGGNETRRAAPDQRGLGQGWQRRGIDRDPLDDIQSDQAQNEDWERVEPSGGSGTEGYW